MGIDIAPALLARRQGADGGTARLPVGERRVVIIGFIKARSLVADGQEITRVLPHIMVDRKQSGQGHGHLQLAVQCDQFGVGQRIAGRAFFIAHDP